MKTSKASPKRVAFLLNANAKNVSHKKKESLAKMIPPGDLYFSESLEEAERIIKKIIDDKYSYIFCGGGDGTVVCTINLLNKHTANLPEHQIPLIGVLRLGTGNALARILGARSPKEDIKAILSGQSLKPMLISMVETKDGLQAPFAGIGYDGELMNDFEAIKQLAKGSPLQKFFTSFWGFTVAGFFRTLPRQRKRVLPKVKITSSKPIYRIVSQNGRDEEIFISDSTLYEGIAPLICVGTVSSLGYGIKMFPFANKRPGYMHIRVSAVPVSTCIANLYPAIWKGSFRHSQLFDFLVKDVSIESNEALPYQFAGDAMGYQNKLFFKISDKPVAMASLYKNNKTQRIPNEPLLMPLI